MKPHHLLLTTTLLLVPLWNASSQLIQLDFNDEWGEQSLENHGTLDLEFTFGGVGSGAQTPEFSTNIPPVNAGGWSSYQNLTDPTGANPHRQFIRARDDALEGLDNLVSVTLTGWFYFELEGTRPYYLLTRTAVVDDTNTGFLLYRSGSNERLVFQVGSMSGGLTFVGATPAEQWVFFAIVLDASKTEDNLQLYIGDGENLTLFDNRSLDLPEGHIGANEADLIFGNRQDLIQAWSGHLDNMRIYGSTLDSSGAITDTAMLHGIMTFDDAALIPEVSSISLIGFALMALLLRRPSRGLSQ